MKADKEFENLVDLYEFKDSISLLMICYALSELKKYSIALQLYKKNKIKIKKSGNEIIGLETILSICKENNDPILIVKFTLILHSKVSRGDL